MLIWNLVYRFCIQVVVKLSHTLQFKVIPSRVEYFYPNSGIEICEMECLTGSFFHASNITINGLCCKQQKHVGAGWEM